MTGKVLSKLLGMLVVIAIALVVGMVSPGQWLTERSWELKQLYYRMVAFKDAPPAQEFVSTPFELKIVYLKNEQTGAVETYLASRLDMLPIYELNQKIQVGKFDYRVTGVKEEAQQKGGKAVEDMVTIFKGLF